MSVSRYLQDSRKKLSQFLTVGYGAEALSGKKQRFLPALPEGEPSSPFGGLCAVFQLVRNGTSPIKCQFLDIFKTAVRSCPNSLQSVMAQRPSLAKSKDFCQLSQRESQVPLLAVCALCFSLCGTEHLAVPHPSRLHASHLPPRGRRAAAGNGGTVTPVIVQRLWGSPGSIHEGETDCTTGIPFSHHTSLRTGSQ